MIYDTPNWPYDLTEAQKAAEERAINHEINARMNRLTKLVVAQTMKMLDRINSTRQWWDES